MLIKLVDHLRKETENVKDICYVNNYIKFLQLFDVTQIISHQIVFNFTSFQQGLQFLTKTNLG